MKYNKSLKSEPNKPTATNTLPQIKKGTSAASKTIVKSKNIKGTVQVVLTSDNTKKKNNNVSSPIKYASANERLTILRQQLQDNLKPKILSESSKNQTSQEQLNVINSYDENLENSWMNTSSENVPMDWEPISDKIILQEIKNIRELENEYKESTIKIPFSSPEISFNGKYYFVIDTNVFLSNLKSLQKIIFQFTCKLDYSFLVVPYIVLQELDCIKMRNDKRLAQIAQESIRYLNKEINSTKSPVQGQNVFLSTDYLIEIINADDKILNCCLQIQRSQNSVILLSNDINLRNKALFNNIESLSMNDCILMNTNIVKKFESKLNNV